MKEHINSCISVEGESSAKNHDVYSTDNGSILKNKTYPMLVNAEQLAELLNVSVAHIYRMRHSAKLPEPVKFGGSVRWPIEEIKSWIAAGLPNRIRWNEMKGGAE